MDPKHQRGIVIAAMAKILHHNGLWVVPSQSAPAKSYLVDLQIGTCTCEDFKEWSQKCKHIYAAEIVAKRDGTAPVDLRGTDTIPLDTKKTYPRNWPAINATQTVEKDRFQVLLHDLCRHLKTPKTNNGRPRTPLSDVVFAAAFKIYSTLSTRRFASDLRDAHRKGFVTKPIHYNSICAYLEWPSLTPVLTDLIRHSCAPLRAVETDFAVDSSGFSTSRFVRWFDEKYGLERSGHDWVKVHVMSGVKTNIVTAIEIRGRDAGDAPLFRPLVETTKKDFKINEVSADKAYSSVANIEAAFDAGATPYIAFKTDATEGAGGLWGRMFHLFQLHRDEYLAHYHKRSNVESTFNMIKSKFRDHVRSRTDTAMKNEVLCKVLCHNICCVLRAQSELGVDPVFWPSKTVDGAAKTEGQSCTL